MQEALSIAIPGEGTTVWVVDAELTTLEPTRNILNAVDIRTRQMDVDKFTDKIWENRNIHIENIGNIFNMNMEYI